MNASSRFELPDSGLEFDLVRRVYSSCAWSTFGLGLVFNVFLLWMIVKKTPAPMLIYSKLLMAPCVMDIFITTMTFLVQPIPIVDHGYHAVIQNGFFRKTSSIYNYTANVLWFQMLLLFLCCTTIQFLFRYYMIIGDGQIPNKLKYFTGVAISLLLVAHIVLHYWSDFPYAEYVPQMQELAKQVHTEVGITDIRFSSFTPARSYQWILHCIAMISIFFICYCIIVFCSRGTRLYISQAYANTIEAGIVLTNVRKNLRLQEYNNQVTTALLVQAVLPTVEVIELSVQTTLPIFLPNTSTISFMIYAAVPLYFIPMLNPLATLLLVKPYRKALWKLFSSDKALKPLRSNQIQSVMRTSNESPPALATPS